MWPEGNVPQITLSFIILWYSLQCRKGFVVCFFGLILRVNAFDIYDTTSSLFEMVARLDLQFLSQ